MGVLLTFVDWAMNRLKEPTSYAGLYLLFQHFGISDQLWGHIGDTAMAGAALATFFLKEKAS